ncbi:M23 family metallopeptidase [Nocardioides caeni]|nr:M23 family metallopeptidase [Nocardioides caeni]
MGSHRADHRAPRRRSSTDEGSSPTTPQTAEKYVGKRVAGREPQAAAPTVAARVTETPATPAAAPAAAPAPSGGGRRRAAGPTQVNLAPVVPSVALAPTPVLLAGLERTPTVELPALRDIPLFDPLTDSSTTQLRAIQAPGKRRAVKHAGPRGPLFKGLPSLPVAVGVATLAVAIGGAVVSADPQLASGTSRLTAANAMTGSFGSGAFGGDRGATVSRDSDRDALAQGSTIDMVEEAERHAEERNAQLGELVQAAEAEAAEIALNRWVLPLDSYRLTATFGEYGLWSSYHTGLDFAAPSGTPIKAVTNGVITSTGFDGAYGNKTVLTLEDGTEIWFCHQSATTVSAGDTVRAGEVIGYVGTTGHVTGAHLHLEVRPGGGDPVDPDAALRQHGVTP